MEKVLEGLLGVSVMIYVDDLVIYSRDARSHAVHLQEVFDRMRKYNLTLNPKKCVYGKPEVKLLGYVVGSKGHRANPEKVRAIKEMPAPQTVKGIRRFLGMTGYYRTLMPDYAKLSEPLVRLTKKSERYRWGPEQQQSFEALRDLLCSDRIVSHPRTKDPYLLYTDASDIGIGPGGTGNRNRKAHQLHV